MAGLEVSVDPLAFLRSPGEHIDRLCERIDWTCAIDTGVGSMGTGILVGPDLVLTNFHVMEALLRRPEQYAKARCRFDFRGDAWFGDPAGTLSVGFAADWDINARSRYSDKDLAGADAGFDDDHLDYAIIRLVERIGEQPVTNPLRSAKRLRGWLTIPDDGGVPVEGTDIWIWQHPSEEEQRKAMPIQESKGRVLKLLDGDLRLRHSATTRAGSSGAACFDNDFRFIALHHAGDPKLDRNNWGKWNQAIPVTAIVRHLRRTGHGALVGVVPPRQTTAMPRAAPVQRQVAQVSAKRNEKRQRAAMILMDREDPAGLIQLSQAEDNPGLVHAFACRHVDNHRNFLERLVRLPPAGAQGLDTRRRLEAVLLGKDEAAAPGWALEHLTWPGRSLSTRVALGLVQQQLRTLLQARRPTIVEAAVAIDGCDVARERELVLALARHCADPASGAGADRLQVIVVYCDNAPRGSPDRFAARRAELGALWSFDARPPGCGACLAFDDVGSADLTGWCGALQTIWKIDQDRLFRDVDGVLPDGRRLPMLEAEDILAPVVRGYVEAAR